MAVHTPKSKKVKDKGAMFRPSKKKNPAKKKKK